jgi:hypothetical protein
LFGREMRAVTKKVNCHPERSEGAETGRVRDSR